MEELDELIVIYSNRRENSAGGNLHIILDDQNIGDSAINVCLTQALEHKDYLGAEIAKQLLAMNVYQRQQFLELEDDQCYKG
jgi:hypothetical protein